MTLRMVVLFLFLSGFFSLADALNIQTHQKIETYQIGSVFCGTEYMHQPLYFTINRAHDELLLSRAVPPHKLLVIFECKNGNWINMQPDSLACPQGAFYARCDASITQTPEE